ncbi:hypothetical protein C9426_33975 [Serratia sp. S1B]|nr:hypothetical protein C9426_33975 [Serratia sp. S1B]
MEDLYSYLNEKKGYEYKSDQIKDYSFMKIYPVIDMTRELRGNSRIIGDADKKVQDKIIDMLITISSRYSLNYKEIAYVLLMTKVESGFNPDAAAGTTSASGLVQGTTAFAKDAKDKSKEILGFQLDIEGANIFDAEKGCYSVVYSFLLNKAKVSKHYTPVQIDYWRWLYVLHHDGAYSLGKYLAGKRKISSDGNKWANYILEKLPVVEGLLKSQMVSTSFKLSTDDGTPIDSKNYVATISMGLNSFLPNIVSTMENPLTFIKGMTDSEGKTEEINTLAGAEIVFTVLKDNYKMLAMSGGSGSSEQTKKANEGKKKNNSTGGNEKSDVSYTVKPGDTLSAISKEHGKTVAEIAEYNNLDNVNVLHVGQVLKLSSSTYTVKPGDTLSAIAKAHGKTVEELAEYNNLTNINVLNIGQVLKLSGSSESDNASNINFNYISRYVSSTVKQAIMKYLGIDNANINAAISYARSHIALPAGSTSADIEKKKNVIHIKTTKKATSVKKNKKAAKKHKTDDRGTVQPTTISNDFEPVVLFARGIRSEIVSEKSIRIIKEIIKSANIHKVTISSTIRTPQRQVDAMYDNMRSKGIQSQLDYYGAYGREVILAAIDAGGNDPRKVIEVKTAMLNKVIAIQNNGGIVSRHCVSEQMYATRNVIDISKRFSSRRSVLLALDKALKSYSRTHEGFKYISPFQHSGEAAFHVEIEQ